jgi:hypothetical protein
MPKGKPRDGTKNPGGRPVEWTTEIIEALADKLITWSQFHTACYLESFCAANATYPQKLSELAPLNTKFSEALKRAKAACSAHIAEATAGGEMPPAFGIFALKQHGWRDKQEIEHSGAITSKIVQVNLPTKKPVA